MLQSCTIFWVYWGRHFFRFYHGWLWLFFELFSFCCSFSLWAFLPFSSQCVLTQDAWPHEIQTKPLNFDLKKMKTLLYIIGKSTFTSWLLTLSRNVIISTEYQEQFKLYYLLINSIGLSYITCSEMFNFILRRNPFVDVEDMVYKHFFCHRYSRSAWAPPQPSIIFSSNRQHIEMPFHILLDEYMRRVFWNNFTVFEQVKNWTLRWSHS